MRDRRAPGVACVLVALAAGLGAGPAAAAPPRRVVALTPFTANTLASLGVRPVGIGQTLGGHDRLASSLRGVRRLALSHPNGPNLEQLASLNPQLVLSTPTWHRGVAPMRRLHIRVVESDPRSVHAVPAETRRIARLVGRSAQGARVAAVQTRSIRAAQRGIRRHPRVLVVLGVGRTPYAFLANSWGGDVVRRAGGRLLTSGLRASGGFARISNETVVQRNPDIIIAVPHGAAGDLRRLTAYLKHNPAWKRTNAARHGRVYVSTGNSLLQPFTDVGRTISDVRRSFLHT